MTDSAAQEVVASAASCMEHLVHTWTNSKLKSLTLTSVGIAIGHANLRRVTGDHFDLRIWIH